MASPLEIILDMILLLFGNTAGTMRSLIDLLSSFIQSMGIVSGAGLGGFVIALVVLGIVVFLAGRFLISSWKILLFLFLAGLFILFLLGVGGV